MMCIDGDAKAVQAEPLSLDRHAREKLVGKGKEP